MCWIDVLDINLCRLSMIILFVVIISGFFVRPGILKQPDVDVVPSPRDDLDVRGQISHLLDDQDRGMCIRQGDDDRSC